MTIEPNKHEVEDFEKTISFESGQFAIVDAEVVKSMKDKMPLAEQAIFVATKQSRENGAPFKVVAHYDDATLRELKIVPASDVEASEEQQMEEGIQILGHEENPVKKKVSRINRIGGDSRPKTADRSERNKRYSKHGDPKTKLTKGKSPVEKRVEQAASIDGARRDNYGQPRNKVEKECMELLLKAKEGFLNEEYLNSLENLREIRQVLADVRDNNRVKGSSFDLVYNVVQQLDEHWRQSACVWVEDVLRKGNIDVG